MTMILLFPFVMTFLISLPLLSISAVSDYFNVVWDVLRVVCYLIPVHAFIPLINLSIAIVVFKIICNVVRWIWDMLPIA